MTILPRPGRDGLHHPRDEHEIAALLHAGARAGQSLRVRGAAHSVPAIYQTDLRGRGFARGGLDVCLDRIAHVAIEGQQVEVGGGARFGRDPRDPTGRAVEAASLGHELERAGLALPVLGGVSQQTVAGFFATGSEGGSLAHALSDQVVGLTLVDGTGRVHELSRERDGDLFLAAGCSLGLLGVVTRVRLRAVPGFDVAGSESAQDLDDAEVDLLARGETGVASFLDAHEYARLLWWPQPGVDRLVVWKGARAEGNAPRVPYRPFPTVLRSTLPMQAAAGAALSTIARALDTPGRAGALFGALAPSVYRAFVPVDAAPRAFRDRWHRAIPLDDEIDERLLPTSFTEIWLPLESAAEAMRRLREHFALGGFRASSTFVTEIYGAPASPFLLHPGHGRASVRVNAFWFGRNGGDPRAFFGALHERLWDLGARLHWGKHLLAEPAPGRLRAHHPRWDDFLRVRAELDPGQVLVNDYLRAHLGIAPRAERVAVPVAIEAVPPSTPLHPRVSPPPARPFPLLFEHAPGDPAMLESAPMLFDHRVAVRAPAELVFDAFCELHDGARWAVPFGGIHHRTEEISEVGAVMDETFSFMTIRLRTVVCARPHRQVWSVDACSLPLATRMTAGLDVTPLADGRVELRWRVASDPRPELAFARAGATLVFDRFFAGMASRFAGYIEERAVSERGRSPRDARRVELHTTWPPRGPRTVRGDSIAARVSRIDLVRSKSTWI